MKEQVEQLAQELLSEHAHRLAVIPKVVVSNRKTTDRLGTCFFEENKIVVYWKPMDGWHPLAIADVILHELAHIAQWQRHGWCDHSPRWREIAEEFGARPRVSGQEEHRLAYALHREVL